MENVAEPEQLAWTLRFGIMAEEHEQAMPMPTQLQIALCYADIFKNHDGDHCVYPLKEFAHMCELEKITLPELEDIEFMCDRVDVWLDNDGLPGSSYSMPQS